jgi:hypothetical protein
MACRLLTIATWRFLSVSEEEELSLFESLRDPLLLFFRRLRDPLLRLEGPESSELPESLLELPELGLGGDLFLFGLLFLLLFWEEESLS